MKDYEKICFLLKKAQHYKSIRLIDYFKKHEKGAGTILASNIFYFTLLDKIVMKDIGQNWIIKPKGGLTVNKSIKEWLEQINCNFLLEYSSISTLRTVLVSFNKCELIHIDQYNRMFIKYPVDGVLLSPGAAAKEILKKIRTK